MEPRQRRVLAQLEDSKARGAGWFTSASLPAALVESGVRRLKVLSILTSCTFAFFYVANLTRTKIQSLEPCVLAAVAASLAFFISLAPFLLSRLGKVEGRRFLTFGSIYQVTMASLIGFMDHLHPWADDDPARGWSGVAVWILIYAVFVPSAPAKTIRFALVAALMDPIGLLVNVWLGNPLPPAPLFPLIFGPTAIAVVTAVVASRINYSMGRKIHDAEVMGSYQLVELLGEGGMGEVWRAEHKMLARPAAIKLIRAEALGDGSDESVGNPVLRFEREAQATAQLESEHTVELYDFGVSTDGTFYYVMELLQGMDLDELVARFGPIPPERAIHLLQQVCESLTEAHENDLIHRDIKPSNIFICRKAAKHDFVKVLDFGLVKATSAEKEGSTTLTEDGMISGTPAYMVPEVILGSKDIDGRADLYALGCVAYWLLSGTFVFEEETPMQMVVSHASGEPERLSERASQRIPPELEAVIHACLEKTPDLRPQSAAELGDILAGLAREHPWTQRQAREWWAVNSASSTDLPEVDPTAKTAAMR